MKSVLIRPTTGARRTTRRTALAAALLLASSTLTVSVPQQADAETSCLNGGGIDGDPFLVAIEADLRKVGSGVDGCTLSAHYLQTQDIMLTGPFTSIGRDPVNPDAALKPFNGTYDGGGHTISGLQISEPEQTNVGLFGHADDATLRDVHLVGPQVVGKSVVGGLAGQLGDRDGSSIPIAGRGFVENVSISGGSIESKEDMVGGVVGQGYGSIDDAHSSGAVLAGKSSDYSAAGGVAGENSGEMTRSSASGTVTASGEAVGGLVGGHWGGSITNSWASGTVVGGSPAGGLAGWSAAPITSSYATGDVSGTDKLGGLVGEAFGGSITDSYATGEVSGTDQVGGLVGHFDTDTATITNSYSVGRVTGSSNVGGLVGQADDAAVAVHSFWDTTSSGLTESALGAGLETAAMRSLATYSDWSIVAGWQAPNDDSPVWGLACNVNGGYPYLIWESADGSYGGESIGQPCPTGGSGTTSDEPTPSQPLRIGGVPPTVPTGSGAWVRADGTSTPLVASSPAAGQLRYEADGVRVTLTGTAASSPARGLVADPAGEIVCEVCVAAAAGQVMEVWLFSTPRLVAAHRVDDTECHLFAIPLSAPLDGQGAVSAGAHTLQLAIPTSSGMQAVNVGVTVGGPVPASVRAGEGPVPFGAVLLALLAAAGALLAGRRLVTAG